MGQLGLISTKSYWLLILITYIPIIDNLYLKIVENKFLAIANFRDAGGCKIANMAEQNNSPVKLSFIVSVLRFALSSFLN